MVDYLPSLNIYPSKIRNQDYWYLSPLPSRNEKEPSFKLDRKKNVWYDHAISKGGDLYHYCSISELLNKLSIFQRKRSLSFGSPAVSGQSAAANFFAGEKKETATDSKIVVAESRPISAKHLASYFEKRCIPLEVAGNYCREVDFLLYSKPYTAIGFENNSGSYELRNENYKGSSSPKDISIVGGKDVNVVFEGFFSFLSFATINKNMEPY